MTGKIGTPMYMAPELMKGGLYAEKIDIYAIGIILFELICKMQTTHERIKLIKNLTENRNVPNYMYKTYSYAIHLLLKMTSQKPGDRPDTYQS